MSVLVNYICRWIYSSEFSFTVVLVKLKYFKKMSLGYKETYSGMEYKFISHCQAMPVIYFFKM